MLLPKRVKYRKRQKGKIPGLATRGNKISFGDFGLQAVEQGKLTNRQIEAARVAMNRHCKRQGKMWIRIFPDTPYTAKPAETRQGKGKGNVEGWVAKIREGTMLFELDGVDPVVAKEAMRLASSKLPLRTRFVKRENML